MSSVLEIEIYIFKLFSAARQENEEQEEERWRNYLLNKLPYVEFGNILEDSLSSDTNPLLGFSGKGRNMLLKKFMFVEKNYPLLHEEMARYENDPLIPKSYLDTFISRAFGKRITEKAFDVQVDIKLYVLTRLNTLYKKSN